LIVPSPHAHHPGHVFGQGVEHGFAALFVARRGHQAERLVVEPQPGRFRRAHGFAIDHNLVGSGNVQGRARDDLAVHRNEAGLDHALGVAAAGDAGA